MIEPAFFGRVHEVQLLILIVLLILFLVVIFLLILLFFGDLSWAFCRRSCLPFNRRLTGHWASLMVQTDHSTHLSRFLPRERSSHERRDKRTTRPQEMRSLRGGHPSPDKSGSRRSGSASRGLVAGPRWATNPAELDGQELHGRRRVLQQGCGPGRRGRSSSRPASRRLSSACRRALDPRHRRPERERLHPGGEDQPDSHPAQAGDGTRTQRIVTEPRNLLGPVSRRTLACEISESPPPSSSIATT